MNPPRELLPVELLVRDDQRIDDHTRRVTIDDQQKFHRELAPSQANQQADEIADELDDTLADPIHDHAPAYRSSKSKSRLLSILDGIERGDG